MPLPTVLQGYTLNALRQATYEPMEDGRIVGRVPALPGVIAFGDSYEDCRSELISVIEDWARVGVQHGLTLPVMGDVDLNTEENRRLAQMYD